MRSGRILEDLIPIARKAGGAILDVYAAGFSACAKRDASPATDADERAEEVILNALAKLTPGIPVVSEEAASKGDVPEVGARFFAGSVNLGAFMARGRQRQPIACRHTPPEGLTVVSSRSHADVDALDAYLAGRRIASHANAGSSLKFCMLAAGEADLYPRLGRTMEWDTAAGHAVLAAAGGRVTQLNGEELTYGKPGFTNPQFVAMGLER
jgi:3'(2'), 5'-bisphosphate nucleotidase